MNFDVNSLLFKKFIEKNPFSFEHIYSSLQSSLSKTDIFVTAGTKSPSKSDVLLTRSQINEIEKGRNQLQMSSLQSRLYKLIWDVLVWYW